MIVLLVFLGQRVFLASFLWQFALKMQFLNTLIPGICLYVDGGMNSGATLFKKPEIMPSSFGLCGAQNPFGFSLGNYLCFERVLLFLTGVIPALFFFGRSIGVSVTSTSTTSQLFSACNSFFFPGK